MLVLSLFPGIGMLDMAFEEQGLCVVRGPDVLWGGDVRRFTPPAGRFDGVIGGPPCQTFSKLVNLVRAQGHEPRFGNLIPEFERCVAEAQPTWFLMENVPDAPTPVVPGYEVHTQRLNNRWLGAEQHRVRAFSFGYRGELRKLAIETVALEAALRHETIVSGGGRTAWTRGTTTVVGDRTIPQSARQFAGPAATVTSIVGGKGKGGDGKAKRERTAPPGTVTSGDFPKSRVRSGPPGAVTLSDGGASKRMWRYGIAEALELQGLPPDFLEDAPFTVDGKRRAIANGVPLPMGRAVAAAVLRAVANGATVDNTLTRRIV
jgi:site-specific DNA-cytosine methylase